MRLAPDSAIDRLGRNNHGVLATAHPTRGADAVPVVYAASGGFVGIPIDTVKPKVDPNSPLQRETNLERNPRATLLVEHWDANDWSKLWWVRAELSRVDQPDPAVTSDLTNRLVASFGQYRDKPFARLLVFSYDNATGWSAEG